MPEDRLGAAWRDAAALPWHQARLHRQQMRVLRAERDARMNAETDQDGRPWPGLVSAPQPTDPADNE
jgi:hypothetical protein